MKTWRYEGELQARLSPRVAAEYLLLDSKLHFEAARVRLCPDEASVDQLHLVEALKALDAEREELTRLELGLNPGGRRVQVSECMSAARMAQ